MSALTVNKLQIIGVTFIYKTINNSPYWWSLTYSLFLSQHCKYWNAPSYAQPPEAHPLVYWMKKAAMLPLQLLISQHPLSFVQIITSHLPWETTTFSLLACNMGLFPRILLAQLFPLATVTEVKGGFRHTDLFIEWLHKSMGEYRLQPIGTLHFPGHRGCFRHRPVI